MPPATVKETIVVVGGSLAGARSVQALRREGHTGPLTLVGAEAHWPPYDRPPLSKQVLLGAWQPARARLRLGADLDLAVMAGRRAESLDLARGQISLDDGAAVNFDRLVIATGARPRTIEGSDHLRGVHVLRTLDDSIRLRDDLTGARHVVVVGAGFIGCEVASACRSLGLEVALVDVLPRPLAPLGPVIGDYLIGVLRSAGVQLHLGAAVSGLSGTGRVTGVDLADGTTVGADVVVVGIGVSPATSWLKSSGLTIDDGVVCEPSCLAVGAEGRVAAAGDVARWSHPRAGSIRVEHWTNATEQAAHAARALLHGPGRAGDYAPVPYFWSDQFGLKLQLVGVCRPDHRVEIVEGSMSEHRFVAAYTADATPSAVLCVNMPRRLVEWQTRLSATGPAWPGATPVTTSRSGVNRL